MTNILTKGEEEIIVHKSRESLTKNGIEMVNYCDDRYDLYVNGWKLGEYIYGDKKKYLNPQKWAIEQIKKRNVVIERNIKRLEEDLSGWRQEQIEINYIFR